MIDSKFFTFRIQYKFEEFHIPHIHVYALQTHILSAVVFCSDKQQVIQMACSVLCLVNTDNQHMGQLHTYICHLWVGSLTHDRYTMSRLIACANESYTGISKCCVSFEFIIVHQIAFAHRISLSQTYIHCCELHNTKDMILLNWNLLCTKERPTTSAVPMYLLVSSFISNVCQMQKSRFCK